MSPPENFASRWSRLKRESESRRKRKGALREDAPPSRASVTSAADESEAAGMETRATHTADLASLPSIDSITADTDIRMFLQPGVPAELTEAALRRAWVSDPAIRDFIGIAENQWDFTNPTTIPGFGALQQPGDKLSLVAQAAGILDRSPDEICAGLPDTHASGEKMRLATSDSHRGTVEETAPETQAALATRPADRETSNAAPETGRAQAKANSDFSQGKTSPQHRGHRPVGALPR